MALKRSTNRVFPRNWTAVVALTAGLSSLCAAQMATPSATSGMAPQIATSSNKAVAKAMNDALPMISEFVGIHRCALDKDSLLHLNSYGVPGRNFQDMNALRHYVIVGGDWKYHEKNICPAVKAIDRWQAPALNALRFRVVFFADDSGESDTFEYSLRKSSEGIWQLDDFRTLRYQ